ncbi:pygopus homolog 1 [Ctenodactylus gundi]
MSADQEKEPIALKRARGGDSGLEGLGGPGVQLGSPDKKKRKANSQGQSFPPLSEYAPPPNPNSDHLVAANPFDDNYSAVSYKPLAASGPYLGAGYAGLGGYGPFRMAPHGPPRAAAPYCAPYALRGQPPPFPPGPLGAGFGRPHAFGFGPPEGAGLGGAAYGHVLGQNVGAPGQHFRPSAADAFAQAPPPPHAAPAANPDVTASLAPGSNSHFASPLEAHHPFVPPPSAFAPAKAAPAKPDFSPGAAKAPGPAAPAPAPAPGLDDAAASGGGGGGGAGELKPGPESGRPGGADAALAAQANGTPRPPRPPRAAEPRAADAAAAEPAKACAPAPADPVYPCGICAREVNDDQDAILCEASCQKWFHRVCTGMTETAYGLLTAEAAAVWGCDACMADRDVQLLRAREAGGAPAAAVDA